MPELESIVVLNISSWGAGVNLWGKLKQKFCFDSFTFLFLRYAIFLGLGDGTSRTSQSYHDGILEVVGIYSSFHIAQLQVGLSAPIRLGQAKTVEVIYNIFLALPLREKRAHSFYIMYIFSSTF